ncbi:MAG: MFS transporter [Ruminococcaceae bacterium]|nr:MFS transporter [Oscillospiraceae bacterium]
MISLLLPLIYISFISLGLPDALLGAAWPTMCLDFAVPVSLAGVVSVTVAMGTVVSSLLSDRLTLWLGAGKVTAFSVGLTALALFGFSVSSEFWHLLVWAIPYGLGAGSVDASLNNYVALHYASRHMSWLHCMWGIGASVGPYVMGSALTGGLTWNTGYRYIALFQVCLTAVLLLSLPLWKTRKQEASGENGAPRAPLSLKQILAIPGAKEVLIAFFCYCAAEQTAILWGSTYLVRHCGMAEDVAAGFASLFLIGMTIGRFFNGFLTYKLSDKALIRLGQGIMLLGVAVMLLPFGTVGAMAGLLLIGLGCAPIYPCVIHSTPDHFGEENSQAIIGVQMAAAYTGVSLMPPLFGILANHISVSLLPLYVGGITVLMIFMCERLNGLEKR